MINSRKETVKLLNRTFSNDCYSNLLLDNVLSGTEASVQDKRFITTLYYGVLERKITLDHIISTYSSRKINKLDMTVLNILRTGVYQIKYMDSVPDSAAVNESVKLASSFKMMSSSGFINAVLRNFIRDGANIKPPKDKLKSLSVKYSVAPDIIKLITESCGKSFTQKFLERLNDKTPVYLRINNTLTDEDKFSEIFSESGIIFEKTDFPPFCFKVQSGNLTDTDAFRKGLFHVQDISSQLACLALEPCEGQKVLDLCSAPGGKTFTIAELMNGTGTVYASDIYEQRAELIDRGARRLSLGNIKAFAGDASVHNSELEGADRVLCDVPCSGLGVMRKKPEIRCKQTENFEDLYDIQYKILENAASYLKVGGILVYSTCTVSRRENDDMIDRFLSEHENFSGVPFFEDMGSPFGSYKALLGADGFDSDGFFISKIKRIE